ncbi:MAG: hypothetical protein V4731_16630 [Pseudomonadota bacterium]
MLLTISIKKVRTGYYQASSICNGMEITDGHGYPRIEDAIAAEANKIPTDFGTVVEFRYGGFSSGSVRVDDAPRRAQELADRLVHQVRASREPQAAAELAAQLAA